MGTLREKGKKQYIFYIVHLSSSSFTSAFGPDVFRIVDDAAAVAVALFWKIGSAFFERVQLISPS